MPVRHRRTAGRPWSRLMPDSTSRRSKTSASPRAHPFGVSGASTRPPSTRSTRAGSRRIVAAGRLEEVKGMRHVLLASSSGSCEMAGRDASRISAKAATVPGLSVASRTLGLDGAVTFFGHVSHRQVASELSRAEVFLHLSLTECPQNALMSAINSRRKVESTVGTAERLPNVVKEAMRAAAAYVWSARPKESTSWWSTGRHGFVVRPRRRGDGSGQDRPHLSVGASTSRRCWMRPRTMSAAASTAWSLCAPICGAGLTRSRRGDVNRPGDAASHSNQCAGDPFSPSDSG